MAQRMQESPVLSLSPSFNSYSSGEKLAEIAARVIQELKREEDSDANGFEWDTENFQEKQVEVEKKKKDDEDEEFEFAFVCRDPDSSPISADEIFYNGQIRPTYPLFDTGLLLSGTQTETKTNTKSSKPKSLRLPLRTLMIQERESPSCSSSEADEFDGVPDGTYCVWTPTPKPAEASPGRCKKSNSTGSSKRWKFRDLLYRSNSDGKDTFVFLAPSKKAEKAAKLERDEDIKVAGKAKANGIDGEEVQNVKKRDEVKEGEKRRSFLPYRQDLVGFVANVNGLSRNLHPF